MKAARKQAEEKRRYEGIAALAPAPRLGYAFGPEMILYVGFKNLAIFIVKV